MTLALAVGALQMFRVHGGWLTNYGADLFGTAWLYMMFREGRTVFQKGTPMRAVATALFVFAGCAASEFGQRAHVVPGRFDWLDLVAYAAAVAACLALDWTIDLVPDTPPASRDDAAR